MEYIREGSVLPIPFNIIPTPSLVYEGFCTVFGKRKVVKELRFENFSSANVGPRINVNIANGNGNGIANGIANGNLNGNANGNGNLKVCFLDQFLRLIMMKDFYFDEKLFR